MNDILEAIITWPDQKKPMAIATVTETWGSSPRQAGAMMVIGSDLSMAGSVSGGCVETAVVEEALQVIRLQRPKMLHYGVSDETAWDVGLACGGNLNVFVEPISMEWAREIVHIAQQHATAVTCTILNGELAGEKAIITNNSLSMSSAQFPQQFEDRLMQLAQRAMQSKSTQIHAIADQQILFQAHVPPARLMIVGGAHIAQALARFASLLDFQIIVIDPRSVFSTRERFPDAQILRSDYPDAALKELGIDSETYIAILTHDPKIDDRALTVALPGNAAYIGVLSGKRSQELRLKRLADQGIDPSLFARLHVPVGLSIGATTPEEIALSILAEIIAVRRGTRT